MGLDCAVWSRIWNFSSWIYENGKIYKTCFSEFQNTLECTLAGYGLELVNALECLQQVSSHKLRTLLKNAIRDVIEDDYVWPHPNGTVRGIGVEPLHPSVPFAAMQDAKLYEMLALFDALRVGRARERGMAHKRLPLLIYPDGPKPIERPLQG